MPQFPKRFRPRLSLRCFLLLAGVLPIGLWGLHQCREAASKEYGVVVKVETGWEEGMEIHEKARRLGIVGRHGYLSPGGAFGKTANGTDVMSHLGGLPQLPVTSFGHPDPCTWWDYPRKQAELERELDRFVRRNPDLRFGRVETTLWVTDPDPEAAFIDKVVLQSLAHHPAAKLRLRP